MRQPVIDLMPAAVRARAMSRLVIGRYVAALVLAVLGVVVPALLARVERSLAAAELSLAGECKTLVEQRERSIREKQSRVAQETADLDNYDTLALPLPMSRIIATLVNTLPRQLTLEKVNLRVQLEPAGPASGERSEKKKPARRPRVWIAGELRGFGPDDLGPADYTSRLKQLGLCESVKLERVQDRDRRVRDAPAREFLISFAIDLNRRYELREPDMVASPEHENDVR